MNPIFRGMEDNLVEGDFHDFLILVSVVNGTIYSDGGN